MRDRDFGHVSISMTRSSNSTFNEPVRWPATWAARDEMERRRLSYSTDRVIVLKPGPEGEWSRRHPAHRIQRCRPPLCPAWRDTAAHVRPPRADRPARPECNPAPAHRDSPEASHDLSHTTEWQETPLRRGDLSDIDNDGSRDFL